MVEHGWRARRNAARERMAAARRRACLRRRRLTFSRLADLRPRSGRAALFAAHADQRVERAQPRFAWTYHMRPRRATIEQGGARARSRRAHEVTPLVVDGLMYVTTPYRRVRRARRRSPAARDLGVRSSGSGPTVAARRRVLAGSTRIPPRILFGTRDGRLIALDARSGEPAAGFGERRHRRSQDARRRTRKRRPCERRRATRAMD